jgi:hypothetical protein
MRSAMKDTLVPDAENKSLIALAAMDRTRCKSLDRTHYPPLRQRIGIMPQSTSVNPKQHLSPCDSRPYWEALR